MHIYWGVKAKNDFLIVEKETGRRLLLTPPRYLIFDSLCFDNSQGAALLPFVFHEDKNYLHALFYTQSRNIQR